MVYVDNENKCHTTNQDGTFRVVEDSIFEGKCQAFIEGYCYDDSKGYVQIYPWKPYDELDAAQREYERQKLADAENALAEQEATIAELDSLILNLQYNNLINN
jgi:hypothetical protein